MTELTGSERAPGDGADLNEFRRLGHEMIEWAAAYLERVETLAVLPKTRPGSVAAALPLHAPEHAEPLADCFADFQNLIVPNTTHWNHPGFLAYFAISGSPPGILGELLSAVLNVNAMVWRTGPAATELEEVTLAWVRELIGLPTDFDGTINDTASSSTLYALAAAREQLTDLRLRQSGMPGRTDVPRLRVYCSEEAHSSVDKAVITLGLGLDGLRRIRTMADYRLDTVALREAIHADIADGVRPMAVVGTVGTTSTTAVDPIPEIAAVCAEFGVWLHVDAAYGGSAAILPEMRWIMAGCERADSLVVNPHKWMLVPVDLSVLYTRKPTLLRAAFSLTPEYLVTPESEQARNLMDYGLSLGRRFRSLKLWFVLRSYGADGLRAILRSHIELAAEFASRVDRHQDFERLAPQHFSVVVFRHRPAALVGDEAALDRHNLRLLERINTTGRFFLSHTRARGHIGIRLAIGNQATQKTHVEQLWQLLQTEAVADNL